MTESFEKALLFVLEREGGYVNDPSDPGGETNFGISKRAYPDLDIKTLTREAAAAIYRKDYWDKCQCDKLPSGVDLLVFDTAVNEGPDAAIRLLQLALNVSVDGRLGPITLQTANLKRDGLCSEFTVRRIIHYINGKNFNVYGLGWIRRAVLAHDASLI